MRYVSLLSPDALKRALFQQGRVSLLHAVAFASVALSFLANHVGPFRLVSCTKTCGLPAIISSLIAWWPIAVSWLAVKRPRETFKSFLWWQVLFVLVNVAAVVGYAMTDATSITVLYAASWSILHFVLLMAIAPLAVEWE
jgi:hypothetical protein